MKFSLAAARRGASVSPSSSRRSTRAPDSRAFPRPQRLTRGIELERVRHEGKRVRTASLDVRATASLHAFPRVGFVVPRYKHSAVDRNRLKRRLRELVRLQVLPTLRPLDLVIRVNPSAYQRELDTLRDELLQAVRRVVRAVGDAPKRDAPKSDAPAGDAP